MNLTERILNKLDEQRGLSPRKTKGSLASRREGKMHNKKESWATRTSKKAWGKAEAAKREEEERFREILDKKFKGKQNVNVLDLLDPVKDEDEK